MKKNKKKNTPILQADENIIKPYAERIAELKMLNADLTVMLEEYRKREKSIIDTLSYVEQQRKEMEKEIKIKYSLESERLSSFRQKWINAVKSGTVKGDFEHTERVLEECKRQLLGEFCEEEIDECLESHRLENTRLENNRLENNRLEKRTVNERYESKPAENKVYSNEQTENTYPTTKRHIDELSEQELEELLEQI